jgi:(2R)-3-sulfolactate dehydrogenase (NADP+)
MSDFLKTLAADAGIRLPGQRRFKQRATALEQGIDVTDAVLEEIQSGIRRNWAK